MLASRLRGQEIRDAIRDIAVAKALRSILGRLRDMIYYESFHRPSLRDEFESELLLQRF